MKPAWLKALAVMLGLVVGFLAYSSVGGRYWATPYGGAVFDRFTGSLNYGDRILAGP